MFKCFRKDLKKLFFKDFKFWIIILIALLIGVTHVSFVYFAKQKVDQDEFLLLSYKPGMAAVYDMTCPYAGAINDVLDGKFFYNEPFTYEGRYKVWPNQQKVTIYFLSFIAWIFGSDISNATLFYFFLFPLLSFIFMFLFLYRTTENRYFYLSIIAPLFVFLLTNNYEWKLLFHSGNLFENIKEIFIRYFGINYPMEKSLNFIRVTTPLPNFLWYLLFLFLLVSYLKKPNLRKSIYVGLSLGFAFYTYIYLAILMIITTVIAIVLKYIYEKEVSFTSSFICLGVGAILSIPFFIMFFQYMHTDYGPEYIRNVEQISRFDIKWIPTLSISFISLMYMYIYRKMTYYQLVLISTLLSGLVSINLQLIFGTNTSTWHWVDLFIGPFILITAGSMISKGMFYFTENNKFRQYKLKHTAGFGCIAILLCAMVVKQANFGRTYAESFTTKKEYKQALHWIDDNLTEETSMAILKPEFVGLIPAHTSIKLLIPQYAQAQLTLEEFFYRLGYACSILEMTSEEIRSFFNDNIDSINHAWFPTVVADRFEYIGEFINDFEKGRYSYDQLKGRFRCTHVLIDDVLKSYLKREEFSHLKRVIYKNPQIEIYEINREF